MVSQPPSRGLPIDPLYIKFNDPRTTSGGRNVLLPPVLDLLGGLSMTSQFKLSMHLNKRNTGSSDKLIAHLSNAGILDRDYSPVAYDFFCSEASLPGVSFNSVQEIGSRQGVVENFPALKIYPPFDVTFYVDNRFKIIRLFEEWMNFINPLNSSAGVAPPSPIGMGNYVDRPNYFRFKYPDDYKRIISVTKFERNFRVKGSGEVRQPPSVTYRLIDAYPNQLNSIPVTYESSIITKTTVSFLYTRFVMEVNQGINNDTGVA